MDDRRQMHLRVLTETAEIDAVAAEWRALEAASSDRLTYFQTYDWCRAWVESFCRPGGPTPQVRTVWRGDGLVAVWPLMVVETAGIRRLETLGEPHSQYCNALIRDDAPAGAVVSLLLEDDGFGAGCDVAVLKPVPASSPLARGVARLPPIAGYSNEASILDLSGYDGSDGYWAQLGKLQKRNRNRRRNQLARLGELDFQVVWPGGAEFAGLVETAVAMKRRWLSEKGRLSVGFAMNGYERFLNSLSGDPETLSGACVSVLRAGERVVAVEIGFIRHRHYYAYIGGFDWDLQELSPGKVQMEMTVCWLIDHGVVAYDLLANPADYKKSWSNHSVAVTGYAVPLTWKGHLYAGAWLARVRPALKRAWARVPEALQAALGFARGAAFMLMYV